MLPGRWRNARGCAAYGSHFRGSAHPHVSGARWQDRRALCESGRCWNDAAAWSASAASVVVRSVGSPVPARFYGSMVHRSGSLLVPNGWEGRPLLIGLCHCIWAIRREERDLLVGLPADIHCANAGTKLARRVCPSASTRQAELCALGHGVAHWNAS